MSPRSQAAIACACASVSGGVRASSSSTSALHVLATTALHAYLLHSSLQMPAPNMPVSTARADHHHTQPPAFWVAHCFCPAQHKACPHTLFPLFVKPLNAQPVPMQPAHCYAQMCILSLQPCGILPTAQLPTRTYPPSPPFDPATSSHSIGNQGKVSHRKAADCTQTSCRITHSCMQPSASCLVATAPCERHEESLHPPSKHKQPCGCQCRSCRPAHTGTLSPDGNTQ